MKVNRQATTMTIVLLNEKNINHLNSYLILIILKNSIGILHTIKQSLKYFNFVRSTISLKLNIELYTN